MKWLWIFGLAFSLCLMKLPASIHGSFIFDVEQKLSIPDENVTWTKTGVQYHCQCRTECASKVSCKAVTIYNISDELECWFSTQEIRVGHLQQNDSALTLFPIRDGHTSCPKELTKFPGVGCLKMYNLRVNYNEAKDYCMERNSTLFVADTPQHFQRLTANYLPTVPGPYDNTKGVWVGIYDDLWDGGRQPTTLEWNTGQPNQATEQCGILFTYLHDIPCSIYSSFILCEKKSWNSSP